jgi:hypothetical protein
VLGERRPRRSRDRLSGLVASHSIARAQGAARAERQVLRARLLVLRADALIRRWRAMLERDHSARRRSS